MLVFLDMKGEKKKLKVIRLVIVYLLIWDGSIVIWGWEWYYLIIFVFFFVVEFILC